MNLKIKHKLTKFLEKIGENLWDLVLSKDF